MLTQDDPRLQPYADIGPARRIEPAGVFVAEGEKIVRRMWASDWVCDTVLVSEKHADRIRPDVPAGAELLVVTHATMEAVLGFKFHSGVMATGLRRAFPTAADWLSTRQCNGEQVRRLNEDVHASAPLRDVLLVLPEINDPLNLGAILRNAAAFGVGGVLLGPACRDPLSRQTIRTSMGTIFTLPLARSADLVADLKQLRESGYQSWATVLDETADVLDPSAVPERLALLIGHEGQGLPDELVAAADRRVTIPMQNGTDSLNVAAASAVFLYAVTRTV